MNPSARDRSGGSLIYDPAQAGIISTATDTDSFTLLIDPGQKLTVTGPDGDAALERPFSAWRDPDDPYQLMVESFADSITELAKQNPGVKNYDISKAIDNSFVKSALDRGLAK